MGLFHLPDLGEGLPDAEIHEWHVKVGDTVTVDQALVSVETAKAVVEVPSPQAGTIKQCFGEAGDILPTGAPLVAFEEDDQAEDEGTVVGKIETSNQATEDNFSIGFEFDKSSNQVKAIPAARILANHLKIDLSQIKGTGPNGTITVSDVNQKKPVSTSATFDFEGDPLKGFRRTMAHNMVASQNSIVPVCIYDDADISDWSKDQDISVTLIRSMAKACAKEPALNAWFDGQRNVRKLHTSLNLGLAVDTTEGLYVPIIRDVDSLSDQAIREQINTFKQQARDKTLSNESLQGAGITLSNFGNFAGRYASPIIVPPMVAIVGIGQLKESPLVKNGSIVNGRVLPISLTFDHRCITGGEATRFMAALIEALQA